MASIKNLRLVVAISNFGVVAIPASMAAAMVSPCDRAKLGAVSRRFADDKPTRHRIKRLIPNHAVGDGKTHGQAIDRAAIGGQTAVRPPMAHHSNGRADRFRQVATGF